MNTQPLLPLLAALMLTACAALQPTTTAPPTFYSLDMTPAVGVAPVLPVQPTQTPSASRGGKTLLVNAPHAAAGYDSQRIIYIREPHKLEYFAHSEWVDPPARMLAHLLVGALEARATFAAVVMTPSAAKADLRLETEIVRLQHDFTVQPSEVRFTLRAYLIDDKTRAVVATREFNHTAKAAAEDAYGGVQAASTAVQEVLAELTTFCASALAAR